jgi:hypothetical protein
MAKMNQQSRQGIIREAEPTGTEIERKRPAVLKTSGAAPEAVDTSRSPVANRDPAGPRKAGRTPRPTEKPIVD